MKNIIIVLATTILLLVPSVGLAKNDNMSRKSWMRMLNKCQPETYEVWEWARRLEARINRMDTKVDGMGNAGETKNVSKKLQKLKDARRELTQKITFGTVHRHR